MKEVVAATTVVLAGVCAVALVLLPPPRLGRAVCQQAGGRPIATMPASGNSAAVRCQLP